MRFSLFMFLILLLFPTPSEAGRVRLREMAVTTRIVKGKPIDSVHRISRRSVKVLHCYSRGSAEAGIDRLSHVWRLNGRVVEAVDLPLTGSHFAVSSSRKVSPSDVGEWRVDLVTPDGAIVRSVTFRMN